MKGVALLSSGIDSAVAIYLMMKKDADVVLVHCEMDNKSTEKAKKLAKHLAKIFKKEIKLYQVNHSETLKQISGRINPRFICNICKRMMYRIAERIAEKEKAEFLVTGESLGQVASQTLDNLAANKQAVKIEIVRPLISWDKQEIVDLAKEIGTYEISIEKAPSCPFVPKHPATKAKTEQLEKEEKAIDIDKLLKNMLKNAKTIYIK